LSDVQQRAWLGGALRRPSSRYKIGSATFECSDQAGTN
jgi:hypothetical protein